HEGRRPAGPHAVARQVRHRAQGGVAGQHPVRPRVREGHRGQADRGAESRAEAVRAHPGPAAGRDHRRGGQGEGGRRPGGGEGGRRGDPYQGRRRGGVQRARRLLPDAGADPAAVPGALGRAAAAVRVGRERRAGAAAAGGGERGAGPAMTAGTAGRADGGGRTDFVHLHVHSEYSLLDGAARLKRLVEQAARLGFPALALTDHGNLFGAIEFYQHARAHGIKPILGCELYIAPGSRFERAPQDRQYEGANHVTALVRNETGYRNLIKLVSQGYLEGFYYKPRVDRELLARYADGLLILSGCLNSEVARL